MGNYPRIREQIKSEIEASISPLGDVKIYKFLLSEIADGDVDAADEFMLSAYGGYTPGQLNKIKIQFFRKQNQASNPVHAF
jgi:hypothetical protein